MFESSHKMKTVLFFICLSLTQGFPQTSPSEGKNLKDDLKEGLHDVVDTVEETLDEIIDAQIPEEAEETTNSLEDVVSTVEETLDEVIDAQVPEVLGELKEPLKEAVSNFTSDFEEIVKEIAEGIITKFPVSSFVIKILPQILTLTTEYVAENIVDIINSLVQFISTEFADLIEFLKNNIILPINRAMNRAFPIHRAGDMILGDGEMTEAREGRSMFDLMPRFVQDSLPAEARTGTLGVFVVAVVVTSAIIAFVPVTYYAGYFVGKYFIYPLLSPFGRQLSGRSLMEDTNMLDNLTDGVMRAVETYNLLQSLNTK